MKAARAQQIDFDSLSEREVRRACDEARARVAENPADEDAARDLAQVVEAAMERLRPPERSPTPDVAVEVNRAAQLLATGSVEQAEVTLRRYLSVKPNDPEAMRLMAQIAGRFGFLDNAERILRRSVELDPSRVGNWIDLAKVIHQIARGSDTPNRVGDALAALDRAILLDPANEEAVAYKAALLVQVRRLDEGRETFEQLLDAHPESWAAWMNYSYLLKTLGRFPESVAGYRTAVAINPLNAAAWWGFANLKRARFFDFDIEAMLAALERLTADTSKVNMHFALATAFDQKKDYASAAEHFRRGNAIHLKQHPFDADAMARGIDEALKTYAPEFFTRRKGLGDPSEAPIFVIGMPRSGSTLVEQILSSHPAVEGTEELQAIQQIEGELSRRYETPFDEAVVERLRAEELRELGARYLKLSAFHRTTDKPRFTDKNPGNWRQVGFIHSILPNAKFIDVRRNPLDCCFANFAQHFSWGVNHSYGLAEVAFYYGEYLRLMRHFEEAAPGVVHRLIYEDLVDDLEAEVRKLLDYLELPFDERCLRFFETERPVHTPSSEQVRQPINRSGFGRWAKYRQHLPELESSLRNILVGWRA